MKDCFKVTCVILLCGMVLTSVTIPTNDFFMNLERKLENEGNSDEDNGAVVDIENMGKSPLNFAHNLTSLRKELNKFNSHADELIDRDSKESAVIMYIANTEYLNSHKNQNGNGHRERRVSLVPSNLFNSENSRIDQITKPSPERKERRLKMMRKTDNIDTVRESTKLDQNYNMFELAKEGKLFDLDPHAMYAIDTDDLDRFRNENTLGD